MDSTTQSFLHKQWYGNIAVIQYWISETLDPSATMTSAIHSALHTPNATVQPSNMSTKATTIIVIVVSVVALFLLGLIIVAGVAVTLHLKKSGIDAPRSDADQDPIYETLEESFGSGLELAMPQAENTHPPPLPDVMRNNTAYNLIPSGDETTASSHETTGAKFMTKNGAYNLHSPSEATPSMKNNCAYKPSRNESDVMTHNCAYNVLSWAADSDEDSMTKNKCLQFAFLFRSHTYHE